MWHFVSFVVRKDMTYTFTFDASACSGCKACQIACKDKNDLPLGVLWRRVYEVSGGDWQKQGDAWVTDVFAYNLSIACNHCTHPKCAGVCPTNAYVIRDDGIVLLDTSKCMGCGYCNWACPYSAPQYNYETGYMTKCDFCFDNLELGLPPACVAACPMRVLDSIEVSSDLLSVNSHQALWKIPGTEHPYPLPTYSRTEPYLAIKPHAAMSNGLGKVVANREEIYPERVRRTMFNGKIASGETARLTSVFPKAWCDALRASDEFPLIAFTLLGQMAVGMAVFSLFFPLSSFILFTIGLLLGFGTLISLLHLGSPFNAWRAFNNLSKSWLSREILMTGLFAGSWLLTLISPGFGKWLLAITGIGLVYSMAQVYRLKSAPGWNSWRTPVSFFLSAGMLGALAVNFWLYQPLLPLVAALPLAVEAVTLPEARPAHKTARQVRVSLIRAGILAALIISFLPESLSAWANFSIFLIVFVEDILGRWLFYESSAATSRG